MAQYHFGIFDFYEVLGSFTKCVQIMRIYIKKYQVLS